MTITRLHGPRITLEEYQRSQRPARRIKAGSSSQMLRRQIAAVRRVRELRRAGVDPLIVANSNRVWRIKYQREATREAARAAEKNAQRKTLITAARISRSLGFLTRASKFDGRVSSYYCSHLDGRSLRISDHVVPWTFQREARAVMCGRSGFDGYAGRELLITAPRSATWLRRAIILTAAGRSVP